MAEQKWRIYGPEGRNIRYDVKANLRTASNFAHQVGRGERFVILVSREDYGDDTYQMQVKDEKVTVVAREKGQIRREKGVFDELDSGIFFNVSDENFQEAETRLVKAFL